MQRDHYRIKLIAGAALAGLVSAVSTSTAAYVQLAPFAAVVPAGAPSSFSSGAVVGSTAFALLNGTNASQISATTNLANSPSTSTFTSNTQLTSAGSPSATGQLFDSGQGYLDLLDNNVNEHQLLHVDKTSGAVTTYVSKTVLGSDGILGPTPIPGTGDMAFDDSTSKSIVATAGSGNPLVTVASSATLVAGTGSNTVNGMLVALPGNLYLTANSTSKTIFEYNASNSSWSTLLTPAQIEAVTGNASTSFLITANLYGPDGSVYFFDNTAKEILDFNPTNPTGSLSVAVPSATISALEGTTAVSNLSWYNGAVAWDNITPTGEGFYGNVPEPGTMGVIGASMVGMLRRRRKC